MTSETSDFIEIVPGALDAAFCGEIIQRFEASRAITRGKTGGGVDLAKKDSYDLTIDDHADWRDACARLSERTFDHLRGYFRKYSALLTGALSTAVEHPETGAVTTVDPFNFAGLGEPRLDELAGALYRLGHFNVQKYLKGTGGYHHWHSEVFPRDASAETLHRVLFFQYYLNDVSEGGETEFLYQALRVPPRAGTFLVAPAGFTHTHKGHIPRSGDKYIVTSWVLFRRAEELFPPRR
jgi:hypothetical protein